MSTMEGDTNNSAEARGVDASTPSASSDSSATAADANAQPGDGASRGQGGASASTSSAAPARQSSKEATEERERLAYERLEAGEDAKAVRTKQPVATPSAESETDDDTRGEPAGAPRGSSNRSGGIQTPPGQAAPRTNVPSMGDYGMEEGTYRTLSRAGMLENVTVDDWKGAPSWARGQMVSAAKQVLKARQDAHNAKQQQGDRRATQETPGKTGTQTHDDQDDAGDEEQELDVSGSRTGKPRVGQDARRGAGAGQGTSDAAGDDEDLGKQLEALTDYFGGDETIVAPLKSVLGKIQKQASDQVLQARAEAWLSQSETAFDTLAEKELPQLKESAARQEVLPLAAALYQQRQLARQNPTFGACCRDAARAHFLTDTRLQAQNDLLNRRKAQVSGDVTKVTNNANPQRALTQDEKSKRAYEKLEQGESPEQVRRELQ